MTATYCPGCKADTNVSLWSCLPWFSLGRHRFHCGTCGLNYYFSSHSTHLALISLILTLTACVAGILLFFHFTGTKRIAGWPGLALLPAIILICNISSGLTLQRTAKLEGPIHDAA